MNFIGCCRADVTAAYGCYYIRVNQTITFIRIEQQKMQAVSRIVSEFLALAIG